MYGAVTVPYGKKIIYMGILIQTMGQDPALESRKLQQDVAQVVGAGGQWSGSQGNARVASKYIVVRTPPWLRR